MAVNDTNLVGTEIDKAPVGNPTTVQSGSELKSGHSNDSGLMVDTEFSLYHPFTISKVSYLNMNISLSINTSVKFHSSSKIAYIKESMLL